MPRSTCACRPIADADELVPKILSLKSRTEGVSVKVIGELNRPPYEKGNAGAALYEHAKTLAAEIGFDLVDTFDRRRLRRQFHRAAYRDARRARRRRQGRAYPLRADVHLLDRAEGAAAASAVPDAAMTASPRDTGDRDAPPDDGADGARARLVLRPPQGPQAPHPSGRPDRQSAAASGARYRQRPRQPISPTCSIRRLDGCQARNRIRRRRTSDRGSARAFPISGSSAASPMSTAWRRS